MFATISLGAVFVPLNFRLTGEELAFIIGDAGVHTLVVDPELTDVIDSVRIDCLAITILRWRARTSGYDCLEQSMQEADAAPEIASSAHDTLLIMYTSGTTGCQRARC